jgi:LacI family transcriptional regulator
LLSASWLQQGRHNDRPEEGRREAGEISLSTVSFVLNRKRRSAISRETRDRVWEDARALNCHVNAGARRLARGNTNLVGSIISEISNPFFPDVIKGFEMAAAEQEAWNFCLQH